MSIPGTFQVGDKVQSIDPFLESAYYGVIEKIWWVLPTPSSLGHCRISVLRELDDPKSWWVCDPQNIRKVE